MTALLRTADPLPSIRVAEVAGGSPSRARMGAG